MHRMQFISSPGCQDSWENISETSDGWPLTSEYESDPLSPVLFTWNDESNLPH